MIRQGAENRIAKQLLGYSICYGPTLFVGLFGYVSEILQCRRLIADKAFVLVIFALYSLPIFAKFLQLLRIFVEFDEGEVDGLGGIEHRLCCNRSS